MTFAPNCTGTKRLKKKKIVAENIQRMTDVNLFNEDEIINLKWL